MQNWRTQFADGDAGDWYRPNLWPDFRWTHCIACFVLIPALELNIEESLPDGRSLAEALAALPLDEGVRWAGPPLQPPSE